MQETRSRSAGTNAGKLLKGQEAPNIAAEDVTALAEKGSDAYGLNIRKKDEDHGTTEDTLMQKWVEKEMARRRGDKVDDEEDDGRKPQDPETALYEIPAELKAQEASDVIIPGQWLTGIQEVATSAAAKMAAIERTEKAKSSLLAKAKQLGIPLDDDGPVIEETKVTRKQMGIPMAFGKKKNRHQ